MKLYTWKIQVLNIEIFPEVPVEPLILYNITKFSHNTILLKSVPSHQFSKQPKLILRTKFWLLRKINKCNNLTVRNNAL